VKYKTNAVSDDDGPMTYPHLQTCRWYWYPWIYPW